MITRFANVLQTTTSLQLPLRVLRLRIYNLIFICLSSRHHQKYLYVESAGCNTFDYLIEGAKVTAVDLNAAQIALTDLKAAAIQKLTFDEFFKIFAKNDIGLLREKYSTILRPLLLERSREFWDEKVQR